MQMLLARYKLLLVMGVLLIAILGHQTLVAQETVPLPLSEGRATTELLQNGGFELDADSNKIPDGWTGKDTDLDSADKQKCDKEDKFFAHSGLCAFQFKGNADGSKSSIQQEVADVSLLVNGESVIFSAYLDPRSSIPDTVFGKATVKYDNDTKQKWALAVPAVDERGIEDYLLISDTEIITIPEGATITKVKIKFSYGEASGKYLIDDVSFAVGTPDATGTPSATSDPLETATEGGTVTATFTLDPTTSATATLSSTTTGEAPTATFTDKPTKTATPAPPTNTPVVSTKLVASDGVTGDFFGNAVAFNEDGSIALIGAEEDTVGVNQTQGSVYFYTRSGVNWTQQGQILASDGAANDFFGSAIALSDDGNTAIIGASGDGTTAPPMPDFGSAYIYTRSGTVWTLQQKLQASDAAAFDQFGVAVDISADGNTVIIGANQDDVGANNAQGSAYIFTRSGTVWTEQQKLTGSTSAADDQFGFSVALNDDATTAVVGAKFDDIGTTTNQGSAYVFTRSGTVWTEQQQLVASDGAQSDHFGSAAAISSDGNTVLIGATDQGVEGAVYAFSRSGTFWTQQQRLNTSNHIPFGNFGWSVSLSDSGNVALIGAPDADVNSLNAQGLVYIFTRSGVVWTEETFFTASDGDADDNFGIAVDLLSTGNYALIGASGESNTRGAAYVITEP
jgi:hypothetical protein